MTGIERRQQILHTLQQSQEPISGSALASAFAVSRQIIVQDMALLRAQTGANIISTYQGYILLRQAQRHERVFKVRHNAGRTREELQLVVDLSGTVEDVFVYHRVYGVVRGQLQVSSRKDVDDFMARLQDSSSSSLMQITDDFHYHTVTAKDEETLDLIGQHLEQAGFLAPLLEHEPEGVR